MDKRQRSRETSRSPSVIRHHGFLQTSSDSLFPLVQKSWRNLLLTHHNLQLWDLTRGGKSFSLPCSKLSLLPDAWWLISVLQQAASPHKKLQYFPFQLTSHAIPWRYCHTLWREERPTAHSLLHSLWCVYIHSSFQNSLLCIHSPKFIWMEWNMSKTQLRLEPILQGSHFFLRQENTHSVSSKIPCDNKFWRNWRGD